MKCYNVYKTIIVKKQQKGSQPMELKVQIKQAGKKENKIVTARLFIKNTPKTIGELLIAAVKATHGQFKEKIKQMEAFENGDLSAIMLFSQEQLEQKAASGKIDFGFLKSSHNVSEKKAIETAVQAFEDGLIALFIDGIRYEEIKEQITLTGEEMVTFVRLTMLSGRLW